MTNGIKRADVFHLPLLMSSISLAQIKAECGSHYNEAAMEKWVFYTGPDLVSGLNDPKTQIFRKKTGNAAQYGDGIYVLR